MNTQTQSNLKFRLLVVTFWFYGKFVLTLYHLGVRGWWLDEFPHLLVPATLRRASARAYREYRGWSA